MSSGGIYIWYCHVTGLFYLGSGGKLFGRDGRVTIYFQKSKLVKNKLNKVLSADMLFYGHENFKFYSNLRPGIRGK